MPARSANLDVQNMIILERNPILNITIKL